jgi:predicted permease
VRVISWLRHLWWNLVRRDGVEAALDEEVRSYVDLLAADYVRSGLSPAAARRAALVDCRGVEQVKESARDAWIGNTVAEAARDLRFVLRSLRRAPVFALTAVATLGIGIGGATAIFTVIKGSFLRPLPAVANPDRLVSIEPVRNGALLYDFSYPDFVDLRDQSRTLSGLAAYDGTSMAYPDSVSVGRASVSYVSGEFFSVLGAQAAAGRLLVPADVVPGVASPAVVVGYDFWQEHFGGSPNATGATLRLDGYPLTVVGVAAKSFVGAMALHPMEMWIPLTMTKAITHYDIPLESRSNMTGRLVGRLASGMSVADVQRDLSLVAAQLAAAYPEDAGRTVRVYGGAGMTLDERSELARMPRLLAAAVALLLLIACANVANLTLVRAASRRRELATRLALGASRQRLVGTLMLETGVLAVGAVIVGVALAQILVRGSTMVSTIVSMSGLDLSLDGRVLTVSALVGILTMALVSIVPAIQLARVPVGAVLKDGAAGSVRRRSAGQRALVVLQVAISLVLLLSAAVVVGAVRRALANDVGIDSHGLTTAYLDPHDAGLDSTHQAAFYRDVLTRVEEEPNLTAAGLVSTVPPATWAVPVALFRSGEEPATDASVERAAGVHVQAYVDRASPGVFGALAVPLLLGRDFTRDDGDRAPHVAIVSRSLADALWPHENPVGKEIAWPAAHGAPRPPLRVVGMVADTRYLGVVAPPPPVLYVPYTQWFNTENLTLVIRRRDGTLVPQSEILDIVNSLAANVNVLWSGSLVQGRIDAEMVPQRRASAWIAGFGIIALLLAGIGLYGIVAQSVLQRTREFAVRAALGASPRELLGLVLRDGGSLTAIGIVAGIGGSILFIHVLRSMFAGLDAVDWSACGVAVATLTVVALLASYLPARRAARLDVVAALRSD